MVCYSFWPIIYYWKETIVGYIYSLYIIYPIKSHVPLYPIYKKNINWWKINSQKAIRWPAHWQAHQAPILKRCGVLGDAHGQQLAWGGAETLITDTWSILRCIPKLMWHEEIVGAVGTFKKTIWLKLNLEKMQTWRTWCGCSAALCRRPLHNSPTYKNAL